MEVAVVVLYGKDLRLLYNHNCGVFGHESLLPATSDHGRKHGINRV